jgi:hypothetical protein
MDWIGGMVWGLRAPRYVEAELKRRFPWKLQASVKVAAKGIVSDIEAAWRCYRAGAAAAIFDVVWTLDEVQMPLPMDVNAELVRFTELALNGRGVPVENGSRSPLAFHEANVRKRLRARAVSEVLRIARVYCEEDEEEREYLARRVSPEVLAEIRAQRLDVTTKKTAACVIAKEWLGTSEPASPPTLLDAYTEMVRLAASFQDGPGAYYVPSPRVREYLGWDFILPHFEELIGSDAPSLGVA